MIVAGELLKQVRVGGDLLAEGTYDTTARHDAAGQQGHQLLAQDRRPNAGQGHRPHSVFRLRGIDRRHKSFGQELLAYRSAIERDYGQATVFAGGMGPLPAWVRRQSRVRTWVWSKLLINATRILARQQPAS